MKSKMSKRVCVPVLGNDYNLQGDLIFGDLRKVMQRLDRFLTARVSGVKFTSPPEEVTFAFGSYFKLFIFGQDMQ